MTVLGTALRPAATKVMLLGSGELDKEVATKYQRLGIKTIVVDRYPDVLTMQVAHRAHVINMLYGKSLRALIEQEKSDYIVPEIEATATDTLVELERAGQKAIPTARTTKLATNRGGIHRLAAEELQLPTPSYHFADNEEGFHAAVTDIGLPCIVKPVMNSSGRGQSFIRSTGQLSEAWRYTQQDGRAGAGRVIVEGMVNFDFEITLLAVSAVDDVRFCAPVGHRQEDGDYRESWQPQQMSDLALERAQAIARKVVLVLEGHDLFGVELFVYGDEMVFNEISPYPHDIGMVTLVSWDLSEFALHVRAFLGLPVDTIRQYDPVASTVVLPQLTSQNASFGQLQSAVGAGLQLRLFGKPEIDGAHRLGMILAIADPVKETVTRVKTAAAAVIVEG